MFREQLPAPPGLGRLHSILRGCRKTLGNYSPICKIAVRPAAQGREGMGLRSPSERSAATPPSADGSSLSLRFIVSFISPSGLGFLLQSFWDCARPSREGLSSPREAVRTAAGPHARWPVFSGGCVAFPTARVWDRPACGGIAGPRSRTRRHRLLRVPSSRKRLRNVGIPSLRRGPQRSFLVHFPVLL